MSDVNILLYAYDRGSEFHLESRSWLEKVLSNEQVFFTLHTITGFLRIVTNSRILANPAKLEDAIGVVGAWLDRENTHIVAFEKRSWPLFASMLIESRSAGNLVMDAHIAAMAVSCGAVIASSDRDFRRFRDLRVVDPTSAD